MASSQFFKPSPVHLHTLLFEVYHHVSPRWQVNPHSIWPNFTIIPPMVLYFFGHIPNDFWNYKIFGILQYITMIINMIWNMVIVLPMIYPITISNGITWPYSTNVTKYHSTIFHPRWSVASRLIHPDQSHSVSKKVPSAVLVLNQPRKVPDFRLSQ